MGRQAGRTADDTRRLVLNSAAAVIHERGISATLDDIAAHAGMSKGGVVYHYSNKDTLLYALAEDVLATFRALVEASLDPDDQEPGRLVRAYVRAVLDPEMSGEGRDGLLLLSQLLSVPSVDALAQEDARHWTAVLEDDGLPRDVVAVVTSAADGAWMSALWGAPTDPERLRTLRKSLLAMTREEHFKGQPRRRSSRNGSR